MTWRFTLARARTLLFSPLAVLCLFGAATALFSIQLHEPYRDEVQPFLTAKAVPWSRLFDACRIEGAPPVLYVLAKVLVTFVSAPAALGTVAVLSQAVLLIAIFTLLRALGARALPALVVTIAFGATFIVGYVLGVVVRQYGLALALTLFSMAIFARVLEADDPPRRVILASVLAGAASLTAAHAGCVSLATVLVFAKVRAERGDWRNVWLPAVGAGPGAALTAVFISSYENRTPSGNLPLGTPISKVLADLPGLLEGAVLPQQDYWGLVLERAHVIPLAVLALVIAVTLSVSRDGGLSPRLRVLVGGPLLAWVPLLYIFCCRYRGYERHHLYLVIPVLIVALGLLLREVNGLAGGARSSRLRGVVALLGLVCLAPWFWRQWQAGYHSFAEDRRGLFCSTKEVAALLPRAARVVADRNFAAIGLLFWRPDLSLRSMDGRGRYMLHNPPDRIWLEAVPIEPLVREECEIAPDRVVVVVSAAFNRSNRLVSSCGAARTIETRDVSEAYGVYRIDCACVAAFREG